MESVFSKYIWGFITGDALGCPVEYEAREFLCQNPVKGMTGYGTHDQPAGTWTDDSSMLLATLDSIGETGHVDPGDIMDHMLLWYEEEIYTPYGTRFDIGLSTETAILTYKTGIPLKYCGGTGERDNGNAALARAVPVAVFLLELQKAGIITRSFAIRQMEEVTSITHAHRRSLLASGLLYFFIKNIDSSYESMCVRLQRGMDEAWEYYVSADPTDELELTYFGRLRDMESFRDTSEADIKSTGYVVDTMEAVLWSLLTTNSYRDAVLRAVNLGGDADSIGALTGALAGMYYGYQSIPAEWLGELAETGNIKELIRRADEALSRTIQVNSQGDTPEDIIKGEVNDNLVSTAGKESVIATAGLCYDNEEQKDPERRDSHELIQAASVTERLQEEIRLLRARIEQLTAERDDLVHRECRELQAEYDRKIGYLEQEAMEAELQVRALKRMIELMQAQLNRAQEPDYEQAKARTEEEYREYEDELKKRAERMRREEEHARRRAEKEAQSRRREASYAVADRNPYMDRKAEEDAGADSSADADGSDDKDEGEETFEKKLKRLYRKIVKKLHPDMNPDITEDEKELFRKAVEAYELGDLEALEEIAAMIDDQKILDKDELESQTIERLMELRDRLRAQMERLMAEIYRIKRSFPYIAKSFIRDPVKVRARQEELREYIKACEDMIKELRERIRKMQEEYEKMWRKEESGS